MKHPILLEGLVRQRRRQPPPEVVRGGPGRRVGGTPSCKPLLVSLELGRKLHNNGPWL